MYWFSWFDIWGIELHAHLSAHICGSSGSFLNWFCLELIWLICIAGNHLQIVLHAIWLILWVHLCVDEIIIAQVLCPVELQGQDGFTRRVPICCLYIFPGRFCIVFNKSYKTYFIYIVPSCWSESFPGFFYMCFIMFSFFLLVLAFWLFDFIVHSLWFVKL